MRTPGSLWSRSGLGDGGFKGLHLAQQRVVDSSGDASEEGSSAALGPEQKREADGKVKYSEEPLWGVHPASEP